MGSVSWLQTTLPAEQAVVPEEHKPGSPVLQNTPPPGLPLSTAPSQSLSRPSHVSAEAGVFWLQTTLPSEQALVPKVHTPGSPVLQEFPPWGSPLSTMLLFFARQEYRLNCTGK